jgi:hypothetical protein
MAEAKCRQFSFKKTEDNIGESSLVFRNEKKEATFQTPITNPK